MTNHLYYGDNLSVLRESIADESIDLIYLDPPFNSNANYNVLFKSAAGGGSQAQIEAFEDTWHWGHDAEDAFDQVMRSGNTHAADMIRSLRQFLGQNDMMAYLVMMTARLIQLHRVLKSTGSIYLHCDPTASHYLRIILDAIFRPENFLNEIIWKRTGSHNSSKRFGPIHDTILYYSKSKHRTWNPVRRPYMKGHVEKAFSKEGERYFTNYSGNILSGAGLRGGESGKPWMGFDPTAKRRHWAIPSLLLEGLEAETAHLGQHQKMDFLLERGFITITPGDEWPRYRREIMSSDGQMAGDIWAYQPYTEGTVFGTPFGIDDDVRWMGSKDGDRMGYPTQKPVGLLERIINASSNPGDVVLDPFCGCGTAVHAAHKLGRAWIGIDVTHLAISLIERRLKDAFPGIAFQVHGTPKDIDGARDLAFRDKYQFQWWALSLIEAQPFAGKKKGADGGIDGLIYFRSDARTTERAIVSVKGGEGVSVPMIRDLKGVLDREGAPIGVFLTLAAPTRPMEAEAASAGFYELAGRKYPRLQIITLEQALNGARPAIPYVDTGAAFRRAGTEEISVQDRLL
jgi:DNA modification methylase